MKRRIITILTAAFVVFGASSRQPQRGYRGFIDCSNSYRTESSFTGFPRISTYYAGISTTHGFQFNPTLFVGGGIDFERCWKYDYNVLAVYAEARADMKFVKFSPFGDVRFGFDGADGGGIYFSPSIGYRFNWGRKTGVNLGVGLTLQGFTHDLVEINQSPDGGYWVYDEIGQYHGVRAFFSFRLGFDF